MSDPQQPPWENDPDVIMFVTDDENLAIGAAEQHSLGDSVGRAFGRRKEEVRADLAKTFSQMHSLLEGLGGAVHGYEATEVSFELAFTGTGKVAFVAEAGITTSISVKFTKRNPRPGDQPSEAGAEAETAVPEAAS